MNTPIYDFVTAYAQKNAARFHMPGHKGKSLLGCEKLDITEIDGADVLYSADGIINESENNASSLFSSLHSFYSTQGSTLCIKAMLTLICKHSQEERPLILAARNVHKAFIYAAAMLDFDIQWMYGEKNDGLCNCRLKKEYVLERIKDCPRKPAAVYITSPDYLGSLADIKGIAKICDEADIPLLVDNAHGAYLHFLENDIHPLTLGATMCCDSAHKTLPALTGGAYLHLSKKAEKYLPDARFALSLSASTSPSYLILQSLDLCNKYICDGYEAKLSKTAELACRLKEKLEGLGMKAEQNEPLKVTLYPLSFGYTGQSLAKLMEKSNIFPEFYDREALVLMMTPENSADDFERLFKFFDSLEKKEALGEGQKFNLSDAKKVMSVREAMFSQSEFVKTPHSVGRICAEPTVSCPPAIPVCVSGELITQEIADALIYYGFDKVKVIKNNTK